MNQLMTTLTAMVTDPTSACILGATGVIGIIIGIIIAKAGCGPRRSNEEGRGDGSCVEIYVGNLSYDMTEAQMRKEFERYGAVKSSRIITNRFNSKSKGYGFIEMPNRPEAEAAIKSLHDKDIFGRKLRINEAKNKSHE
jgi:RNA recognition motif-containing protein